MSSDLELIARAQQGDVDAFATLYDRHAPLMLALARRILASTADAQDLLHDVFIEAWQCVRDYEPGRAGVRTWLFVRVRSRALDRLDRRGREQLAQRVLAQLPAPGKAPQPERQLAVQRALAELDEAVRATLELTYFAGLTAVEIAELMAVPEGTVRSRLARGLSGLERKLSDWGST